MSVRKTSIEAYNNLKESGKLGKRRWEVYEVLFNDGPLTTNGLFESMDKRGIQDHRRNSNARLSELRDMELAEEIGTVKCEISGQLVTLYDVTDRIIPKELEKKAKEPTKGQWRKAVDVANLALNWLEGHRDLSHSEIKPFIKRALTRIEKELK